MGPDGLALAAQIVDEIVTREAAARPAAREATDEAAESAFPSPADFLVIVHDKYEFRVPLPGYLLQRQRRLGAGGRRQGPVGISDYMQQRLTDITYVDLPGVGTTVEQFDEVGTVESTKATFELISPVGGTIVAVNAALEDAPEPINEEPVRQLDRRTGVERLGRGPRLAQRRTGLCRRGGAQGRRG